VLEGDRERGDGGVYQVFVQNGAEVLWRSDRGDAGSGGYHLFAGGEVAYLCAGEREGFGGGGFGQEGEYPGGGADHVRMFLIWFFTLDPDDKQMRANIPRVLYLADESAKRAYDNLKEAGYYNNLVSGNISQQVTVDSVQLDMSVYPYAFTSYGTEKLVRTSSVTLRSLVTRGRLRNVNPVIITRMVSWWSAGRRWRIRICREGEEDEVAGGELAKEETSLF
jgi:hypothetical protein